MMITLNAMLLEFACGTRSLVACGVQSDARRIRYGSDGARFCRRLVIPSSVVALESSPSRGHVSVTSSRLVGIKVGVVSANLFVKHIAGPTARNVHRIWTNIASVGSRNSGDSCFSWTNAVREECADVS